MFMSHRERSEHPGVALFQQHRNCGTNERAFMQIEVKPESFFKILSEAVKNGVDYRWVSQSSEACRADRFLSLRACSEQWTGPIPVIHQMLLSSGEVKVTYHLDRVDVVHQKPIPVVRESSHGRKMLEVSIAHIPQHTAEALAAAVNSQEQPCGIAIWVNFTKWFEYGWIFHTIVDEGAELPEHKALLDLLSYARKEGYMFIKLDSAADELANFPVYSW
jgi:hypothetical protein